MEASAEGLVLSQDQISGLLSKQRTRGDYEMVIRNFQAKDVAGIEVPLDRGALAGKTADQVKIGLDNARKRVDSGSGQPVIPGGHALKVVKVGKEGEEQHIYLIDTTKVAGAAVGAEEAPEEE